MGMVVPSVSSMRLQTHCLLPSMWQASPLGIPSAAQHHTRLLQASSALLSSPNRHLPFPNHHLLTQTRHRV